jgi:hypothetical protein
MSALLSIRKAMHIEDVLKAMSTLSDRVVLNAEGRSGSLGYLHTTPGRPGTLPRQNADNKATKFA